MILIVTNKNDFTADFLILELLRRKQAYLRFNTEDFPQSIQINWSLGPGGIAGNIRYRGKSIDLRSITSIWYRRPISPVPSSSIDSSAGYEFAAAESQAFLDSIWPCFDCFWVSHPSNLRIAEQKLFQLKVAASLGFSIAPTMVTNDPKSAMAFILESGPQVVYKPLRRGRITHDGTVGYIYTNVVTSDQLDAIQTVELAPSLFQAYVPKLIEIRVTVIGTSVFAVSIFSQEHPESVHDWRRGNRAGLRHEIHDLPQDIRDRCVLLVSQLGLTFGAIDLILTPSNEYYFLEINPNGQWAWLQQLCPELPLRETLADLLETGRRA